MKQRVYNTFLVGVFVAMMIPASDAATVAREVNTANELYGKGKFEDALAHYQKALARDPQSAVIQYNLGTAHYKKEAYSESVEHLQKALLADDPDLQYKARYNLGNALYKQGISKQSSDVSGAISDLERSLGHYEKNLADIPNDADNQGNYEFVKSELQRLKEMQEQQQDKQQQQQNKSEESQENDKQNKDQQDQKQEQDPSDDQPKNDPSQDPKNDNKGSDEKKDGSGQDDQKQDDQKQNGDKPKNKQDNKDQSPQDNSGDGKSGGQPQDQTLDNAQGKEQGMMTPQEAQMMLDDYQRNDEPKGMLYFKPQSDDQNPVVKDW